MSENLHRGEEPAKPVARRRWRVYIPAIVALLLLAAGIGVVLLEPTWNNGPHKQVRALVAEIERAESDDWLSKLLRKYFPEYGKGRDDYKVANDLAALGIEAVPEILTAAGHRLPSVRKVAAYALGDIGDRRAFALMVDLLTRDSAPTVRGAAAWALGQLGGKEATARLIEAMADSEPDVRGAVASALGDVGGPEATARLVEAMADPDLRVRCWVASGLCRAGGTEAATCLIEAMADSEAVVRSWVALALGEFDCPEATACLIEAMADPNPDVRKAVAEALGKVGDKSVRPSQPQTPSSPSQE